MKKLTASQLVRLKQKVRRTRPHRALQPELIDHLATEIEKLMEAGQDYEIALQLVMQQANPRAVAQLRDTYRQSIGYHSVSGKSISLSARHYRKRQHVAAQFPAWLRGSVVTFLTLMICLMWVSQLFAVPLAVFKVVWAVGLISMLVVFSTQLLFRPRHRNVRPRWT